MFEQSDANAVIVPNFAISALDMMRFAELAARYSDSVETIELHRGVVRAVGGGPDHEHRPQGRAVARARVVRCDAARFCTGVLSGIAYRGRVADR